MKGKNITIVTNEKNKNKQKTKVISNNTKTSILSLQRHVEVQPHRLPNFLKLKNKFLCY